jgi:hypothetical protein
VYWGSSLDGESGGRGGDTEEILSVELVGLLRICRSSVSTSSAQSPSEIIIIFTFHFWRLLIEVGYQNTLKESIRYITTALLPSYFIAYLIVYCHIFIYFDSLMLIIFIREVLGETTFFIYIQFPNVSPIIICITKCLNRNHSKFSLKCAFLLSEPPSFDRIWPRQSIKTKFLLKKGSVQVTDLYRFWHRF